MLNRLSQAIVKRGEYTGTDTVNGPLHGLGTQILAKRPFLSKQQLIGTYGSNTITAEDLAAVSDYIAIAPRYNRISTDSNFAGNNSYKCNGSYRVPVNVNTASWPVLVAILDGIGKSGTHLSSTKAEAVASAICAYRHDIGFFSTWDNFQHLFEHNIIDNKLTSLSAAAKTTMKALSSVEIAIICANCDPNEHSRDAKPEGPLYQSVQKSELDYFTSEFCFFPFGYFDVTSLGQIIDSSGNIIASAKSQAVIQVSEVVRQHSQQQFEQGYTTRALSEGTLATDIGKSKQTKKR